MTAPKSGRGDSSSPAVVNALPGAFPCTDLGNAERMVARNRERIQYCPQRRKWLLWDSTRWAWDERNEIIHVAKETVRAIHKEAGACHDDQLRAAIAKHGKRCTKPIFMAEGPGFRVS